MLISFQQLHTRMFGYGTFLHTKDQASVPELFDKVWLRGRGLEGAGSAIMGDHIIIEITVKKLRVPLVQSPLISYI